MFSPSASSHRSLEKRSGFALLITITLLAFLVLLLVSLASLTRVETQVASNNQQLAQARQNALMALNIALGELQKYAGPDQRTTARSDMDSTLANTSTQSGRWTGVYGRGVATADTVARNLYTDIPSRIAADTAANADPKGNQAVLLNWLVSGNEGTRFDPSSAADANGLIDRTKAPTAFVFTPAGAVSLTVAPTALSTDITITGSAGSQPARLLVGGNSANSASDYVAAPVVDIAVDPASVPGAGGTNPITVGRYAWWVGDEGAKARINLPMATTTVAMANAFVSSQRMAIELVDGKNAAGSAAPFAQGDLIGSAYPPGQANLINVMNPAQLPMLTPASATALTTAIKYRYHDLTAYSASVLSDTYAGGLRKDLSALLARKNNSSDPLAPGVNATDFLFTPEPATWSLADNTFGVPTWGQLRSFAVTTTQPDGKLVPQLPSATQMGVHPVLTYAGIGFAYVSGGAVGDPINLALYPSAVLWNPYTAPIRGAKYEFGWHRSYLASIQLQASDDPSNRQRPTPKISPWSIKETRDFGRGGELLTGGVPPNADGSINISGTGGAPVTSIGLPGSYIRFVIDASDIELAPGESMIFSLASGGQPYHPPGTLNQTELKQGLRAATLASTLMPSASVVEQGDVLFRVAINPTSNNKTMYSPASAHATQAHFTGGEGHYYFGEVSSTVPVGYGPDPARPWYQSFNRVPPGGSGIPATLQGGLGGSPLLSAALTKPQFMTSASMMFSSSGLRWIAQANPRAQVNTRNLLDQNNAPMSGGALLSDKLTANFTVDPSGRVSSGLSLDAGVEITDTTLFELRPANLPLMSMGQLQHANLSLLQNYPAYPLGNSLADYRFNGTSGDYRGRLVRTDGVNLEQAANSDLNGPASYLSASAPNIFAFYDISYLLNRALWDRYFVSTVPHAGTGTSADTEVVNIPSPLPNSRHVRQTDVADADLRDGDKAAAGLVLSGGFNINSTSEQAWRAVLGGINKLPYDPVAASAGSALRAAVPRFAKPTGSAPASSAAWQGYRQLTEPQIAQLARNIVAEVRNRGPFVSMGDFVNRRLLDNPASTTTAGSSRLNADERYKGAIQNAIDATGTLTGPVSGPFTLTGTSAVNNVGITTGTATAATPFTVNGVYPGGSAYTDANLMIGGPAKVAPYGSYSAFAPQFLTQADVLSAIGAGLSARSDTFVIRTYGETVNPTDASNITGRAWCEAVVQRVVEPLHRKSTDVTSHDYNEPAAASSGQPDFGRRFKVISFRWLTSNDI